jgi:two-component system, chemotaxis family, sensor kinase CheA
MTNSPDERGAELRELFYETSQELLQALNDEALKLEKKPGDEEIVRAIRRTAHTLKGDSAACGLREISELAHQFEDALSLEGAAAQTAVSEIAFEAADVFAEMIAAYRSGAKLPATKALSKKIQDLTAAPGEGKKRRTKKAAGRGSAGASAATWTEYEKLAMNKAQAEGQDVLHVVVKIDPHCAMPIAGRQLVHNAISTMGPVIAVRPDAKSPAATKQVEFVLASVQSSEQIAAKCKIPTIVEEVTVEMMYAAKAVAEKPAAEPVPSLPACFGGNFGPGSRHAAKYHRDWRAARARKHSARRSWAH